MHQLTSVEPFPVGKDYHTKRLISEADLEVTVFYLHYSKIVRMIGKSLPANNWTPPLTYACKQFNTESLPANNWTPPLPTPANSRTPTLIYACKQLNTKSLPVNSWTLALTYIEVCRPRGTGSVWLVEDPRCWIIGVIVVKCPNLKYRQAKPTINN